MRQIQLKPKLSKSSQSGFTIIESLMAIIVVGILMTAVAPVIVFSVANRLQARRVELAAQAARTYIDGVKADSITPPNYLVTVDVDKTGPKPWFRNIDNLAAVPAPASTLPAACPLPTGTPVPANAPNNGYCQDDTTVSLYCVDLDTGGCSANSNQDMIVQAFRSVYTDAITGARVTDTEEGYLLGVRVYRAQAFDGTRTLAKGETESAVTGGTGLKPIQAPLLETTTEIVEGGTTYQDFCDRLSCN